MSHLKVMQRIVTHATGMYWYSSNKTVQGYIRKYVILCIYQLDTLYLREQGCEDPLLFFQARRVPRGTKFWKTLG